MTEGNLLGESRMTEKGTEMTPQQGEGLTNSVVSEVDAEVKRPLPEKESVLGSAVAAMVSEDGPSSRMFFWLLPFFVVASAILVKMYTNFYGDSDQFWSYAIGRWIVENGTWPTVDPFSWTVEGKPWITHEWLFCWVLYHLVESIGYIGTALFIASAYLITAYVLLAICIKQNSSGIVYWIYAIGTWLLVYMTAMPRAFVFTFSFIAVMMYLLRFHRSTKWIYLIPLVFVAWGNMHTTVVHGFLILCMETLVATILFRDRSLWKVALLCLVATLMNPYGIGVWEYAITHTTSDFANYINEFQAPDFKNKFFYALYLIIGFTGTMATLEAYKRYRQGMLERHYDYLMLFFWYWVSFIYAFMTVRVIQYAIIFWIICFATFVPTWVARQFRLKSAVITVILGVFMLAMAARFPFIPTFVVNPVIVPEEPVAYLQEHPEINERIFNNYAFGGYLLLMKEKVFIDARADVFAEHGVFQDYIAAVRLQTSPESIMDKYGVKTLLLLRSDAVSFYFDGRPGWKKVYEDDVSVIFTRS
ncbi:hypothetical protein [Heliophilum fasciatum]|uniref:Dolichyl-phosphate-mannose-protein mannosyltransferase n=1 Tax=Heliophilum fasciatum TaxID=35700 RepID=A0A4R2RUX7_9FIRM|nr:hypothetical protein [Heliophilum fasciatum]MCW2277291.1 hypothetical protein [Heliophilum fasciatum]TCP67128.1 hypothetical protein EDD73_10523 [Heliophilum fasciatum]